MEAPNESTTPSRSANANEYKNTTAPKSTCSKIRKLQGELDNIYEYFILVLYLDGPLCYQRCEIYELTLAVLLLVFAAYLSASIYVENELFICKGMLN
jgi:hypothetical protein